jgi:hypothetical protein
MQHCSSTTLAQHRFCPPCPTGRRRRAGGATLPCIWSASFHGDALWRLLASFGLASTSAPTSSQHAMQRTLRQAHRRAARKSNVECWARRLRMSTRARPVGSDASVSPAVGNGPGTRQATAAVLPHGWRPRQIVGKCLSLLHARLTSSHRRALSVASRAPTCSQSNVLER